MMFVGELGLERVDGNGYGSPSIERALQSQRLKLLSLRRRWLMGQRCGRRWRKVAAGAKPVVRRRNF